MPPKIKVTKENIIETALMLVRSSGEASVNARSVAVALNCSTQPVFSNFESMEVLQKAVIKAAYDKYYAYLRAEAESGKYPEYKSYGMAYVRFAMEEKELFKLLFMRDRSREDMSPTGDFDEAVEMIMKYNDVTRDKAMLMHLECWSCVHGIATMIATSFLTLDLELVSNIITDIYQGIRQRHLSEENKNDCNKN